MDNLSKTYGKLTIPLLVLLAISFSALPAQAKYGGGTGEPNDPYLIFDANQMNEIGLNEEDWDKCFKLMADIDLSGFSGTEFNIIGYWVDWGSPDNKPFTGVFDGSDHTISNFTYTTTGTNFIGLFRYIDDPNAQIKDLTLSDPNLDVGWNYVGSLVGQLDDGTVTNCYVEGGVVSGLWHVGGLVGVNYATISNCYAAGSVTGRGSLVGGLVGWNHYGTISNSYSEGSVAGGSGVGGLVGDNEEGTISNSYSNASASGSTSGTWYTSVGGLVGWNGGTINDCYSTGSASGNKYVGGLVGYNNVEHGMVTASFWDIETSGQTTSAGGTGKTTAEMQTKNTFTDAGWDFTTPVWIIDEGVDYPRLWWEISNTAPVANAGEDQNAPILFEVSLDASGSYDPDEDYPLTYYWQLVDKPEGSMAELSDPESVSPTITPDLVGDYVLELVVTDSRDLESDPNYVVIAAITIEEAVTETLTDTEETIDALDPATLKNKNMKNALLNKINAVQQMLDKGRYEDALNKLRNDILQKTNGCADTGQPDKNDWITTCPEQGQVYPLVMQAIELLENLI